MAIYRVHVSVFPLGSSEPPRVLTAIRETWVAPYRVQRQESHGGWLVSVSMEASLPEGDTEASFTERLSVAIWRRLGRYVKVVVDANCEETDHSQQRELERTDYLKLMRTP